MKNNFKIPTFIRLFNFCLHSFFLVFIVLAFLPIANWYYNSSPIWGVDFFYTATLTKLFTSNHVILPSLAWNNIWFSGSPFLSSFPILHYVIIGLFSHFGDLISVVKLWMIVSSIIYFFGVYFVTHKVSRDKILSFILAIGAIYSVGFYGALTWGGSLPSFATQAFLPWTLYFVISYLQSKNYRYLIGGSLLAGLSIWGHPQIYISYIFVSVCILVLFTLNGFKIKTKILSILFFLFVSLLIGFAQISNSFSALKVIVVTDSSEVAASTAKLPSETDVLIQTFNRAQPLRLLTDINPIYYAILAVALVIGSILFFLQRQKLAKLKQCLPYFLLLLFITLYIWIFAFCGPKPRSAKERTTVSYP